METFPTDLFFWTFTWPKAQDVEESCSLWHRFIHARRGFCVAFPLVSGLRVFEMHPGRRVAGEMLSHGLHVHAVIDRYVPVDIVRSIWEREGQGGRLQVEKIPRERALYIGKYLAKARIECLKGKRLWAAFGQCEASKVKDIVVDTRWTESYKFLAVAVSGFSKLRWDQRARIVTSFCMGENIERAFESIGMERNWGEAIDKQEEQELA